MNDHPQTLAIDVRPRDLDAIIEILDARFPPGAEVWVVGSRATGRARRGSDLDLAMDAGRRLTSAEMGALGEAFDDSNLPYAVDLIDLRAVSETFRAIVERERVALPGRVLTPRAPDRAPTDPRSASVAGEP